MAYKPFMQIVPRELAAVMKRAQRGTDVGGLRFVVSCVVVFHFYRATACNANAPYCESLAVCPSVHPYICLYACQTFAL